MNLHDGIDLPGCGSQHVFAFDHSPSAPPRDALENSQRLNTKYGAARLIRQLRVRAGWSQEELAARLNMSVPEIVSIEIGEADCLRILQVSESARQLIS
jgi:ribosome-binding protein aMBF1 (putative translation factor)